MGSAYDVACLCINMLHVYACPNIRVIIQSETPSSNYTKAKVHHLLKITVVPIYQISEKNTSSFGLSLMIKWHYGYFFFLFFEDVSPLVQKASSCLYLLKFTLGRSHC